MKKFAALLLLLLLAVPARAENPFSAYRGVAPSGVEAARIIGALTLKNDVPTLVAEGMAVRREDRWTAEDAEFSEPVVFCLYLTDMGYVVETQTVYQGTPVHMYIIENASVSVYEDGTMSLLGWGYSYEGYCPAPDAFLVPFDSESRLVGVREEDGKTYCLFYTGQYEYFMSGYYTECVTEDGYLLTQVREYELDEDDMPQLAWYTDISLVEAPTVPDGVLNLLAPQAKK